MASSRARNGVFQIRLPRHVAEDATGLGDVVKRVTHVVGIRPCGGCERRAEALNRAFPISRGRRP
jgi:hypothetical protein